MANELQASLRQVPPMIVLDLEGEVTMFADEVMNRAYREASDGGAENILLNFSGVDYLNSAGIAVIIGILTEARKADQRILVTGLTPHYKKVFQMMGLAQYAPVYDTEGEAKAALVTA